MHAYILFIVGVVEMFIVASWTRSVTEGKVWLSGALTFVNISIWYFILRIIIEDVNDYYNLAFYASGCALGTMLKAELIRRKKNEKN